MLRVMRGVGTVFSYGFRVRMVLLDTGLRIVGKVVGGVCQILRYQCSERKQSEP